MNIKDHLHGTIKLIFQPAEAGVMGARSIAESGFLDDVDYICAAHIMPQEDQPYDCLLYTSLSSPVTVFLIIGNKE